MTQTLPDRRINRLFALLEGAFYSAMFLIDGMIAQILSMMGYGDTYIGVILAAMGVSCVVMQPVLGYLCDKFRCYKAIFLTAYTLVAVSMPLFYLFAGNRTVAMLYCVVTVALVKSLFVVLDSWVTKIEKQGVQLDYGRLRSVGSVTYAFAAVLLAQILNRLGNASSVWLYWIIFAVMLVALIKLPDPVETPDDARVTLRAATRILLHNPRYTVFLICGFLTWIGLQSQLLFNSRLVSSLGGDVGDIGVAYFVMAFVEFFVILNFTKIADKLGTENTLALGMVGVALKGIACWLCPSAGWAVAAQLLQAASYALVIPGVVRYFGEHVPRSYLATAFVVYQTLSSGLSQILFSPVYGSLSDRFGVGAMLALTGLPSLLSAAILLLFARSRAGKAPTASDCAENAPSV